MNLDFNQKVKHFTKLMRELSSDIITIYKENKEDVYHDSVLKMIKALAESQEVVSRAYNLHLNRKAKEN